MAAYEILLLNTAVPQIQAAQAGDTYVVPRDIAVNAQLTVTGNVGIGTSSPGVKLDVSIDNATAYNPVTSGVYAARVRNAYGSAGNTQALITYYCDNYSSVWNAGLVETSNGAYTGAYVWQNRTGATTYAERMRLDSSGNLGIGTTSPGYKVDTTVNTNGVNGYNAYGAQGGASEQIGYRAVNPNATGIFAGVNGFNYSGSFGTANAAVLTSIGNVPLLFGANNTEFMRLNSSGNLGLGVTPSAYSGGFTGLEIKGQGAGLRANGSITVDLVSNTTGDVKYASSSQASIFRQQFGQHQWFTAPSGTAGNAISFTQRMTLTEAGDLGVGTTNPNGWRLNVSKGATGNIAQLTDGVANTFVIRTASNTMFIGEANNLPLAFVTNDTERARITSGGYFKASNNGAYLNSTGNYHENRTTTTGEVITYFSHTHSTNPFGLYVHYTGAAPNGTGNNFLVCQDTGATRVEIRSNGGLANYQSNNVDLSDIRTKTDINPLASYWGKIAALEIVSYKYKDQTHDDLNIGVIAQQVEQVAPEFVDSDGFGETPEDGVPLKTIYNKDLTFAAIKALQEAMARIETLEAKVAQLEGN